MIISIPTLLNSFIDRGSVGNRARGKESNKCEHPAHDLKWLVRSLAYLKPVIRDRQVMFRFVRHLPVEQRKSTRAANRRAGVG